MAAGQTADNHLKPDELSNFERTQLKDAFVVVQSMQNVMGQRYHSGRFLTVPSRSVRNVST